MNKKDVLKAASLISNLQECKEILKKGSLGGTISVHISGEFGNRDVYIKDIRPYLIQVQCELENSLKELGVDVQ